MKRLALLSCALLLLCAQGASAQPAFDLEAFKGGKVYYQPGFSFLNTGPLNQTLEGNGFGAYSPFFIAQGGGAHLVLDKILIGASGFGLNGFTATSTQGNSLQISGGYGLFNLGYLIWSEGGFSLYPMLGIGSGSVKINSNQPLNTLLGLSTSNQVSTLESSQVVLDFGLGADYLVDFNADPEHQSGVLVGLRLGYTLIPSPAQWVANGQAVGGRLPELNTQGFYLGLTLGAGSIRP